MTDDTQLLQEYAMGSEQAFRELVERYVNLVYSAAIGMGSNSRSPGPPIRNQP
jgi:hypothetical protein